jgi:hypothetical protein
VLLLCLAASAAGGCTTGAPASTPGVDTGTPAFEAMRTALGRGAAARERGDAGALRALEPALSSTGIALLRARMPHDLRRAHVGHFLEARAAFGDALKLWVGATTAGGVDAAVLDAYDALVESYHAWLGAYRGLLPERAV